MLFNDTFICCEFQRIETTPRLALVTSSTSAGPIQPEMSLFAGSLKKSTCSPTWRFSLCAGRVVLVFNARPRRATADAWIIDSMAISRNLNVSATVFCALICWPGGDI